MKSPPIAVTPIAEVPVRTWVQHDHPNYKWWALSCTSLGMLLATVNSATLVIALPTLEKSLHTTLLELVWVILSYMIASTVLVLSAGRLSDVFGRKKGFACGFIIFAIASLGAGFAGTGTVLIAWRILQGIGAALLFANASAIVTDAFPRNELGLAMGTNVMVAAAGMVLGPVLGGALVAISWQWVFWFNVPFALIGAAWAMFVLREVGSRDPEKGMDPLGTVLFLVGLTGLVIAISKGGLTGWDDPVVIAGFVAGIVLLPLFVLVELRQRAPMLDLSLFQDRLFSAGAAAAFLNGLSRFALMFVFVFYFQGAQGDSALEAGIKLIPLALGMLIMSPIAGMIADRRGSRGLASLGMLVSGVAIAAMTTLEVNTPFWQAGLWLFIVGCGSGMFNSPNTAAMMGVVAPDRRGVAAGARMLVQQTGAVISIAFVMAVVTAAIPMTVLLAIFSGVTTGVTSAQLTPFIDNMHHALWILSAISFVGAAVCLMRPAHVAQLRMVESVASVEVSA